VSCRGRRPTGDGSSCVTKAKPFDIPKREVWEAFKTVKANRGSAGVDGQSIAEFETSCINAPISDLRLDPRHVSFPPKP
jgi:hypothetical protein